MWVKFASVRHFATGNLGGPRPPLTTFMLMVVASSYEAHLFPSYVRICTAAARSRVVRPVVGISSLISL